MTSVTPLPLAISSAWPSMPKPVTSEQACTRMFAHDLDAAALSVVIDLTASSTLSARRLAAFERGGDDAGAERLGQNQRVADLHADVAEDLDRDG